MKLFRFRLAAYALFPLVLGSCVSNEKQSDAPFHSDVHVVGAMRNVMWKGELAGTIDLDTISVKKHA